MAVDKHLWKNADGRVFASVVCVWMSRICDFQHKFLNKQHAETWLRHLTVAVWAERWLEDGECWATVGGAGVCISVSVCECVCLCLCNNSWMLFGLSVVIKQNSLQSMFTSNVCCVAHNMEWTEGDNQIEWICLEIESTVLSNTGYILM